MQCAQVNPARLRAGRIRSWMRRPLEQETSQMAKKVDWYYFRKG